jgi:hypothetical protein
MSRVSAYLIFCTLLAAIVVQLCNAVSCSFCGNIKICAVASKQQRLHQVNEFCLFSFVAYTLAKLVLQWMHPLVLKQKS